MHLLYLDDSGSASNRQEKYLVLAGVSVFEAQAHYLATEMDRLARDIDCGNAAATEFHASEIYAGRSAPWSKMGQHERRETIKSVLRILANSYYSARAFACAVRKEAYPNDDPVELAFEDLCSRFDQHLQRVEESRERQRGLIIMDESAHETSLQSMARDWRRNPTRWETKIRNLADVPLFVDSKASRIVQLADHVAYAVFRRYEYGDSQYFDIVGSRFLQENGVADNLCHKQDYDATCTCLACATRRARGPAAPQ